MKYENSTVQKSTLLEAQQISDAENMTYKSNIKARCKAVSKKNRLLHTSILLSALICINLTSHIIVSSNSTQEQLDNDSRCKDLLILAQKQLIAIDFTLEEFAFAINSGGIKISDKEIMRNYLTKLRLSITQIRDSVTNVYDLVNINGTLLKQLKTNIISNMNLSGSSEDVLMKAKTEPICTNTDEIIKKLKENDINLGIIKEKLKIFGQSFINRRTKGAEELSSNLNPKLVLKLFSYGLIAAYILNKDKISRYLSSFSTNNRPNQIEGQSKTLNSNEPNQQAKGQSKASSNADASANNGLSRFFDIKEGILLTATITSLVSVKDDLTDLGKWSLKQANRLFSYLKGEPFIDSSLIKKPKYKFKDVVGLETIKKEFSKILDYFNTKDSLDRSGNPVDKAYLLVGPIDSGKKIGNALAGEITEILNKTKNKTCGTCTVHSYSFLNKSLKDVVKEAEDATPCVIIIDEIDWLSSQKDIDPKIWADILSTINSIITNPKKQIFVILTANDISKVDSTLKDLIKTANTLYFENPNAQERKKLISTELSNRSISITNFDINSVVEQTENVSITQLNGILARTFALAHSKQEIVEQRHIEQAINEVIYGISYEVAPLTQTQMSLLASSFAGKALARILLGADSKLLKVSILPTIKHHNIEHGTIINHKQYGLNLFETQDNIKKECLIELAGIVAPKILSAQVPQELVVNINKKVIDEIKKIVYAGISKNELTKSSKEEKKALIASLLADYTNEITQLLNKNKAKLERVATILLNKKMLTAAQIADL